MDWRARGWNLVNAVFLAVDDFLLHLRGDLDAVLHQRLSPLAILVGLARNLDPDVQLIHLVLQGPPLPLGDEALMGVDEVLLAVVPFEKVDRGMAVVATTPARRVQIEAPSFVRGFQGSWYSGGGLSRCSSRFFSPAMRISRCRINLSLPCSM